MKYEVLLEKNRNKILETAARYGASNVRVFGSVARGTDDEASDIDFLVNLAPDRSLFDLGGLLYELHQILGVEVDVVTEDGLRARIREDILSEAVEL
jgi:predicted nucleotidyltransferase